FEPDLPLQFPVGHFSDRRMVESQPRQVAERIPACAAGGRRAGGQYLLLDFDQGEIGDGNNAPVGVPVDLAKGIELLHVDLVQAGQLEQPTLRGTIDMLIPTDQVARQSQFPHVWLVTPFDQQYCQHPFVKPEDDTVYRKYRSKEL